VVFAVPLVFLFPAAVDFDAGALIFVAGLFAILFLSAAFAPVWLEAAGIRAVSFFV